MIPLYEGTSILIGLFFTLFSFLFMLGMILIAVGLGYGYFKKVKLRNKITEAGLIIIVIPFAITLITWIGIGIGQLIFNYYN